MPPPRPVRPSKVILLDLLADDARRHARAVSGLTDDEAVSLRFNKRALPCFTVWRNTPAEADGYVLGIEPGTNYPNPRTFEKQHGRVVTLKPGETWRGASDGDWHADAQSIADEEATIRAIQGSDQPEILPNPRTDWSANP